MGAVSKRLVELWRRGREDLGEAFPTWQFAVAELVCAGFVGVIAGIAFGPIWGFVMYLAAVIFIAGLVVLSHVLYGRSDPRRFALLGGIFAVILALGIWVGYESGSGGDHARFEQATSALQSVSTQGRAAGYVQLASLLDSKWSEESALALLHGLASEDNSTIRSGIILSLRAETISKLDADSRRAAVDVAITLLRDLSVSDDRGGPRSTSLITVLGILLTGFEANGLDLSELVLDGLSVTDCDLRRSSFNHSSMVRVDLQNCDLSESTFIGGVVGASFDQSILRNVRFSPVVFRASSFNDADLSGANVSNYSLAEYDYTYYPGSSKVGSFHGARLDGAVFESPILLLILPAPGEAADETPHLIAGALRWKQPDNFRMGLSYGIVQPFRSGSRLDFPPALSTPIESLLHQALKGDPDFQESLPYVRETILEQFDDPGEVVFSDSRISDWLLTGVNNLR